MKKADNEVNELSSRLQTSLLAFSGRRPGPAPRFQRQLLIPVGLIVGAALLLSLSPKARKSLLLKMTLLASTHFLQDGVQ